MDNSKSDEEDGGLQVSRPGKWGRAILGMALKGHKFSRRKRQVPRCDKGARTPGEASTHRVRHRRRRAIAPPQRPPPRRNAHARDHARGGGESGPERCPVPMLRRARPPTGPLPSPVCADSHTRRTAPDSARSICGASPIRSALLNTSICGSEPAPTSSSTSFTCAMRSVRCGSAASITCSSTCRFTRFLQGRSKRRNELVRQVTHEADGVGKERETCIGQFQPAHGRIKRCEQLVGRVRAGPRQPVEQGGLARVRIADERDRGYLCTLALASRGFALRDHFVESRIQRLDAISEQTTIGFELRFARTAKADAALLPFKVRPAADEPRGEMCRS